jgi:hypothetical protein
MSISSAQQLKLKLVSVATGIPELGVEDIKDMFYFSPSKDPTGGP